MIRNKYITDEFALYHGDCVEVTPMLPDESVGLSIFSPPFAELYTYSDEVADMGNSKDYNEFLFAFSFLVKELFRITMSGRNVCVHCMDLPIQKGKEGYIGLRDFSNMIRESFEKEGFIYHSRITIWKDPVVEMQRTKALGLLHKQVKKDSTMSRVGLPDYVLVFRKDGERNNPVHCDINVDTWQKYASPVWDDINYSNTLNLKGSRDEKDEKHICLADGTLVLTKRGYVPIETVKIGDETLTHTGSWKKIVALAKTGENKETIRVNAQGVPNLICTPNHNIWSRDRKLGTRAKVLTSVPQWNEAKDLLGKYVNQKLPPIVESCVSEQEWWIIGRWIADGHVDVRGHQFFVSIGDNKVDHFIEMAKGYIGSESKKVGCTQFGLKGLSDEARAILFKCGKGAENKVLPYEIISLNKNLSKSFLDGYISGDGCENNGKILFSSVSRALLLGISLVVQRVYNKALSVYAGRGERESIIEGRSVYCKQEWCAVLSPKYDFAKEDDMGMWKRVKSVENTCNHDVYNITVEDDHSYTAEGCIVKNCPLQLDTIDRLLTLYSNEGDTVLTPFLGIGSEVYQSVLRNRKAIGIELKESYYNAAVRNCNNALESKKQLSMFT